MKNKYMAQSLHKACCPICGVADSTQLSLSKNNHRVYMCGECSLKFVYPQPEVDELVAIYDADYFDRGAKYARENGKDDFLPGYKNDLAKLSVVKKHVQSGSLLDVGCAKGHFLQVASDDGFYVEGLEVAREATSCAENLGHKIHSCDLKSAKLPSGKFDVITLWDVIEHLPNPLETARELNRILKKDGFLFVSTGDISSFFARMTGKRWHLLTPPEHLFYFTPDSLNKMLNLAGFEVVDISYEGKKASLDFILLKAEEAFSSLFGSVRSLAKKISVAECSLPINLFDIMTVTAVKKSSLGQ